MKDGLLTYLENFIAEYNDPAEAPNEGFKQVVLLVDRSLKIADWATPVSLRFPATNCTALWWPSTDWWVLVHVGDSEAHLYHEGEMRQVL